MEEPRTPRLLNAGDCCLVAEFGTSVDRALNAKVQALKQALAKCAVKGIIELVPTYRSLAVYYDPLLLDREGLIRQIENACQTLTEASEAESRVVTIPVCYGGAFGPDLENVCAHTGLSKEEVIARHTGRDTYCFMLGFTPGFAYLGGMDESLATPRLENPRTFIPAGSVGIAGKQTGIYPIDSPGGWQLIGRTPLAVFDPLRTPPTLVEAGDWVRFEAISESEYEAIRAAAKAGQYSVKISVRKGAA